MTLVLVPGFMTDKELWSDFEREAPELGPFIHVDLGLDPSIHAMALRAISRAPARFVLVGFSLGGYVAREVVRIAPDRVSALILIATSSRADTAEEAHRKRSAAALAGNPFKGLSRAAIRASLHPQRSDAKLISRIQDMGVRLGHDAFLRQSSLTRENDEERLKEIRCPTLIVAAEEDRLRTVDEALELHQGIGNSTLEIVEDSGHMIPMEQPAALAALIKSWLKTVVP